MVGKQYHKCVGCHYACDSNALERRFYFLPRDSVRRNRWLTNLGRRDLIKKKISYNFRVCEIHFTKDMLGKSKLRINAVPVPIKKNNNEIDAPSCNLNISSEIGNLTGAKEIEIDENIRTNVEPEFIAVDESITGVEIIQPNSNTESISSVIMDTDSNQNKITQIPAIKNLEKNNTINISDNENKISEMVILSEGWDEKCENNQIDNIGKQPYSLIKLEEYNMTSQLDNISFENVSSNSITVDEIIQSNFNDDGMSNLIMDTDNNQNKINQIPEGNIKNLEKNNTIDISDNENNISEMVILSEGWDEKCETNQIDNIGKQTYSSIKLEEYNMTSQLDNISSENISKQKKKRKKKSKSITVNEVIQSNSNVESMSNLIMDTDSEISLELDLDDPAVWPDLNDRILAHLIEKGPKQIKAIGYPVTSGRKFNDRHYTRVLSNGETVERSWLVYSVSSDSIFCFCCKLFRKNGLISISSTGFKKWNHIGRVLKEHEKGRIHVENFKTWKQFELRLAKNSTINRTFQTTLSKEVQHWRDVLKRLVILIKFLSVQSLAFRGGSERLYDKNNGNFLKLVESIAEFDNVLSEHVRRITNNETENNNLVRELISIVSKGIQNKINALIKEAKYFSIMVDCTPDQSRNEQSSLIVRIVHKNQNKYEIKELFMGFLEATDTTGNCLIDLVLDKLTSLGFSISDCRGQGYDNVSNMKGKNIGMQAQIKHLEPRAFFVPCASHSANLVLLDAVQCSPQAVHFFDTVQCLYVFFSSSVSIWEILKKNVKTLTLKPLCTTRWESRIEALKPLMSNLGNIYDALIEICDDNEKDGITRNNANSLSLKIIQYEFICSLIIWYNILERINICSKYLQSPGICLTMAVNLLQDTKQFLTTLRNDEKFQNFILQAKEIALNLDVPSHFSDAPRRPRRKPQLFSDEGGDEIISSPEQMFKVEFYFKILDQAIQSISERLDRISEHNNIFKFLHNISVISSHAELFKNCISLEQHLTFNSHSDIVGLDLLEEIKTFQSTAAGALSPIKALQFIFEKKLESIFPNLIVALRILLTIPVTVATGEDSFSKLKIIKNYLRSTMGQEELGDLATISIESDFLNNLDYSDLIDEFAKIKARK